MPLTFAALDFETANASRASVCQVGVAVYTDGHLDGTYSWLVQPPAGHDEFNPYQSRVHGIHRAHVLGSPTWDSAWADLVALVGQRPVVAHNAAFERSVLRSANAALDLPEPGLDVHCTLMMARTFLPDLPNHKLPTVAHHLGVRVGQHHDAGEDAAMCGQIALALAHQHQADSISALAGMMLSVKQAASDARTVSAPARQTPSWRTQRAAATRDRAVVFAGHPGVMSLAQAHGLARQAGMAPVQVCDAATSVLVVCPDARDDAIAALMSQRDGQPIETWSIEQFLSVCYLNT